MEWMAFSGVLSHVWSVCMLVYVSVSVCVHVCECVRVFVGSCLATKVFMGNFPATGRGWVIIK